MKAKKKQKQKGEREMGNGQNREPRDSIHQPDFTSLLGDNSGHVAVDLQERRGSKIDFWSQKVGPLTCNRLTS
jgi:hypothetical protein